MRVSAQLHKKSTSITRGHTSQVNDSISFGPQRPSESRIIDPETNAKYTRTRGQGTGVRSASLKSEHRCKLRTDDNASFSQPLRLDARSLSGVLVEIPEDARHRNPAIPHMVRKARRSHSLVHIRPQRLVAGEPVEDARPRFGSFPQHMALGGVVGAEKGQEFFRDFSPQVNLIMDSLGALALASEPPVPELLERPPYGRNASLLSLQMKFNLFGQSVYQLTVLLILLFGAAGSGDQRGQPSCDASEFGIPCTNCGGFLDIPAGHGREYSDTPTAHYTILFNAFVMMTLFNWINCRKIYHE